MQRIDQPEVTIFSKRSFEVKNLRVCQSLSVDSRKKFAKSGFVSARQRFEIFKNSKFCEIFGFEFLNMKFQSEIITLISGQC